jgi:lipid II:glycine glycyltransferase (peptidoglycan interpeptide bridge formation enzyme)
VRPPDGAIVFRRRGVTIGESYFDAASAPHLGRVDLLRVVVAFSPPVEHGSRERHTLVIDLGSDEDRLLEQMSKDTRYKIRRAMRKDPVQVAATVQPSSATIDEFSDFYDRFASARALSPAFRPRLHALANRGNLVLTTVTEEDGAVLAQHAYVAAHARSYMLYSASVLSQSADSSARNLIGRANRYLHWHDIRLFRNRGFELYDFGGLDVTGRSEKTARIAEFKRGFGGEVRPVYSSTSARSLLGVAVQRILGLRGVDF